VGHLPKSLHRYRARLSGDGELSKELSRVVCEKKTISDLGWAAEIPSMLQAGIAFLRRAATEASVTDPDVIHSIAGAVKIVAEVQAMRDVLDARILEQTRTDGEAGRQMVTVHAETV
jgi:hypothetical protein